MAEELQTWRVDGMTCTNCARAIDKSLKQLGLNDAEADFTSGEVTFTELTAVSEESIEKAIEKLGYKVLGKVEDTPDQKGWSDIEKKFAFSLLFTLPLLSHMFFSNSWLINDPWVQLGICIPVYALGVWHFGRSAYNGLKAGVANMDVLIFIGSSAAFFYSLAGIIIYGDTPQVHQYLFFETAATIISLVLLGNVLEHRALKKTTTAVRSLSQYKVETAQLVMQIGEKVKLFELDASKLKVGDIVQVNTGGRIPVDGEVTRGEAAVDEAVITGESMPQSKQTGDKVLSGTLIEDGWIWIKTLRPQSESTLEEIIQLVKKARQDKPVIQALGDKVSQIFVPAVVGISIITFLISFFALHASLQIALMRAVAVLVVSCPCAMGLATPTAVISGLGKAASLGILIKGGSTLEQLAQVKRAIFDKTGTLTTGRIKIQDPALLNGSTREEVEAICVELEKHSSHPIARAIVNTWEKENIQAKLTGISEEKGKGMFGEDNNGNRYFLGKPTDAADQQNIDLTLYKNNSPIASIRLTDEIREDAKETIQQITNRGIETIMLSGDSEQKCQEAGKVLGMDKIFSRQTPAQKLAQIHALRGKGLTAMVGDGVNDGPALSAADVGISLHGATAVAQDAAQVVLMGSDKLIKVFQALRIGELTYTTIKQNLFWAFFYNVCAIPLAASGYLNPMIAAFAMAMSDVIVIGNSIRLRWKKI